MEILLPSMGSMAMAGANGSAARMASSCGVGGGGASAWATLTVGLGGDASSVSMGGGCITAGRTSAESMVFISELLPGCGTCVSRGGAPQAMARRRAAAMMVQRLTIGIVVQRTFQENCEFRISKF